MSQIPSKITEKVLAATDLVALIGSYIEVKRVGPFYKALCPFHDDEPPSFSINPVRQFFHCFACKKTGDAITFVRNRENLSFSDAVRFLATRAGIEIPKS